MLPSIAAQSQLAEKIEAAQPVNRRAWGRALALAASLLIVIGGTVGALQLRSPGGIEPPVPTTSTSSNGITGLPVRRVRIGDMPSGDGPTGAVSIVDRRVDSSLEGFFLYDMHSFVLARVIETQELPPEPCMLGFTPIGRQQATLEVLEWAYGAPLGTQEPYIVTLSQSLMGHDNDGHGVVSTFYQANLLRQGGVYLLPLMRHEGEFFLMGDMDVLFEVDERGNVFSHSALEAFSAYDDRPWQDVMDAVRDIVRDNPLVVQYARFARTLRNEVPLAVVTILDNGTKGRSHLTQRARAEQVLVQGTGQRWQVQLSEGEFRFNTYGQEPLALQGERYLAFFYGNELEYSFQAENAARISSDGTIIPLESEWSDWNVFDELAGMTVEQLIALMEKAG